MNSYFIGCRNVLMVVIDADMTLVQFNDAFRNIFKIEQNFKGRFSDFLSEESAQMFFEIFQTVLVSNNHSANVNLTYKSLSLPKDVDIIWEFYRSEQSEKTEIVGLGIAKASAHSIITPENIYKLDALFASTNEASIIISRDIIVEYFSAQAYQDVKLFFGKELKTGDDFDQYILPELRDLFYEKFNEALSGKEIFYEINIPVGSEEGLWYFIKFIPVKSSIGTISSVMYSARNINDIKKYEAELNKQKFYLKSMYESTDTAIAIFDKELRMLYVNKKAFELTEKKFGKKISIGDSAFDFIYGSLQASFRDQIDTVLKGDSAIFEVKDQGEYWRFKIFPIHDENNTTLGVSIHISDITAIKLYENKIIEQVKFLKQLAWSQSHELRGPLSTIMAICDNLDEISDPELKEHMISKIKDYAEQMDLIIKSTVISINQLSDKHSM
ncbi:MAG: PAS domain-containing protein [Thermaurantimonas sp.]